MDLVESMDMDDSSESIQDNQDRKEQSLSEKEKRALRKAQKRKNVQQQHKQILQHIKMTKPYFDKEASRINQQRYYKDIDLQHCNYEQINALLSTTFKHARRRANLFPIVDRHPDYTLRCVYSGHILSDPQGNMLVKCNEQHSFPQSFQKNSHAGTGRDMHAIFAASTSANGSRGNRPFGKLGHLIEQKPYGEIYSHNGHKYFNPNINSGAISRATLYILCCYKNCANMQYLPKESLDWLIEQTTNIPVSEWELHRNEQLFLLQGNRNPFIDHPSLALRISFVEGWQKNYE